jgi:heme/copper-type cytochrome/quinol oxidase subunit 3
MSEIAQGHADTYMETPLGVSPVKFGMWLFLVSEVMFFTGLLGSYIVLRFSQPEVFHESAQHLNWQLAALNTVVLITSSFTMALSVRAAQNRDSAKAAKYVGTTMLLAVLFLIVKGIEYSAKFHHEIYPSTNLFFGSYFTLTGGHGLHVIAGMIPMIRLFIAAKQGKAKGESFELLGLYWHFVDLVWIFLFPLLYLL